MESTLSFEMEKPMDLSNTNPNNPPSRFFKDSNGDCFEIRPRPDNKNTPENRICVEPNNGTSDCYPLAPEPVSDDLCAARNPRGEVCT